jgi:hypothetical protein
LRRLGAVYHGSPALGGLRKLSLIGSEESLPFSSVARATCAHRSIEPRNELAQNRLGCGRSPNQATDIKQTPINRNSNIFQSRTKPQ